MDGRMGWVHGDVDWRIGELENWGQSVLFRRDMIRWRRLEGAEGDADSVGDSGCPEEAPLGPEALEGEFACEFPG